MRIDKSVRGIPSAINQDQVSVDTSASPIGIESIPVTGVTLKADGGNADKIYVGHSSAVSSSTGFPLAAGEAMSFDIDDVHKIYLVAGSGTLTLYWIGVQ